MARRRLADSDRHDERLTVRYKPDGFIKVCANAVKAGLSRPEYVRRISEDGQIVIVTAQKPDPALLTELRRIGVNINQIARKANATGRFLTGPLADEIAALRPLLKRIVLTGTESAPDDPDNRQ